MYTPGKPFSWISATDSGVKAPGNGRAAPGVSNARRSRRFCEGSSSNTASEESLRPGQEVHRSAHGPDVQSPQLTGREVRQVRRRVQEPFDLAVVDDPLGEGTELAHVLLAGEGPGTLGVSVGDRDLILDHCAVGQGDDDRAAEGLLREVQRMV